MTDWSRWVVTKIKIIFTLCTICTQSVNKDVIRTSIARRRGLLDINIFFCGTLVKVACLLWKNNSMFHYCTRIETVALTGCAAPKRLFAFRNQYATRMQQLEITLRLPSAAQLIRKNGSSANELTCRSHSTIIWHCDTWTWKLFHIRRYIYITPAV